MKKQPPILDRLDELQKLCLECKNTENLTPEIKQKFKERLDAFMPFFDKLEEKLQNH